MSGNVSEGSGQEEVGTGSAPIIITLEPEAQLPPNSDKKSAIWKHFRDKETKKGKEIFIGKGCVYCDKV